ncbi:MAG: UvrD-helicase domain-containing protein [Clostridia bacterium]|nr:UvrD-helicase domain-containing protein [Clostridia bacterium]
MSNPTKAQALAIETRDRTLLVSAAAGSGKTFTLIRRILETVTDTSHPVPIDRLLVVTFTRATAAELRQKISAALAAALEETDDEESRAFLSAQLALLPSAKISTIDAFCLDFVRENAASLGLSPAFRIAHEDESRLIDTSVMDALIEECYGGTSAETGISNEEFLCLVDTLYGVGGDGNLANDLLSLAAKLENYPRGAAALFDCAANLYEDAKGDFFLSGGGRRVLAGFSEQLDYYRASYAQLLEKLCADAEFAPIYAPLLEEESKQITLLAAALAQGYTAFCERLAAVKFDRMPQKKGENPWKDPIKAVRDACKAGVKSLQVLCGTPQASLADFQRRTAALADVTGRLLTVFERRALEEKKRRGILTFSDISRYTLKLLVDDSDRDTPLAESQKAAFDAIYIDEYQDVNAVQDRIFSALSSGKNRFMVGDIKQSIYGFRGADPTIFAGLRTAYKPLASAAAGEPSSLFLSENFRCSREIIDFTNHIFDRLMPKISPDIGYQAADALVHKKGGEDFPVPVKIALCEKAPKGAPPARGEAEYIAGEIERLVREERKQDGSRITYGDVLILLRSLRGKGTQIAQALAARGIPVAAESKTDLLAANEIKLVRCLFGVIDNPRNDAALCGLLLSPLCGVTPDYLALLRKQNKDERLYTSLVRDISEGDLDDENRRKVKSLLENIGEFRALARYTGAAELIDEVYERLGLYARIAGQNELRRENLELFRNIAATFGGGSYRSLSDFMRYLDSIEQNGKTTLCGAQPLAVGGAVRMMTVHHSKGLEAPVVFLADTQKKYNEADGGSKILYDADAGFAVCLRDESNYFSFEHLPRLAVRQKIIDTLRKDELRNLYVALTRARERLYVSAELDRPAQFVEKAKADSRLDVPYAAKKQTSFLSLILQATAADCPPDVDFQLLPYAPMQNAAEEIEEATAHPAPDEELAAVLAARFERVYPHPEMTEIPAKLSISALYPGILDEDADVAEDMGEKLPTPAERPAFLSAEADSAAARGTATHLFMQFFDFENAKAHGVSAEIERLCVHGFITPHDASLVEIPEVEAFLRSPLFGEMTAADAVFREQRFNLPLPAAAFTEDETRKAALRGREIFVQGVIDCFFIDGQGEITLIDYKTDHLPPARAAAEALLRARHTRQLSYYAAAIEKLCGRAPRRVLIYSLALGDTVEISPTPLD